MSKLLHAPPCFIHASVRAILTLFVSLCLRRRPLPLLQYQIKQQPKPTSALVCSNSPRVVFIQIILLLQKLNEPCSTQFEVWAKGFLLDYLKRLSKFLVNGRMKLKEFLKVKHKSLYVKTIFMVELLRLFHFQMIL